MKLPHPDKLLIFHLIFMPILISEGLKWNQRSLHRNIKSKLKIHYHRRCFRIRLEHFRRKASRKKSCRNCWELNKNIVIGVIRKHISIFASSFFPCFLFFSKNRGKEIRKKVNLYSLNLGTFVRKKKTFSRSPNLHPFLLFPWMKP